MVAEKAADLILGRAPPPPIDLPAPTAMDVPLAAAVPRNDLSLEHQP
jgi:hypothetical protein